MLKETKRVVFTTREARDVVFSGYDKANAEQVFTKWLKDNLDWVEAGLGDTKVVEIIGVNYDLVPFNNTVLVAYLCGECVGDECEANGEGHETEITECRFTEQRVVSL